MAAGDSVVSICNIGLIALGEKPISSLNDPVKTAILCAARYDQIRRAVLRGAPWNCGKKQTLLAASPTAPLFTYRNAFPLPADFVRMFNLPENDQATWEVIGNLLMTDEGAPLQTLYIFDLQDPTQFDPLLTEAIGQAIGAELARPLGRDKSLKIECGRRMAAGLQRENSEGDGAGVSKGRDQDERDEAQGNQGIDSQHCPQGHAIRHESTSCADQCPIQRTVHLRALRGGFLAQDLAAQTAGIARPDDRFFPTGLEGGGRLVRRRVGQGRGAHREIQATHGGSTV